MSKIKQYIKCFILGLLRLLFPRQVTRIHDDYWNEKYTQDAFSQLVRSCLMTEAIVKKNYQDLALYHENFYTGNKGKRFHDKYDYRFNEWFLKYHLPPITALEKFLAVTAFPLKRYFEIGVGSGSVLAYMAQRFQQLDEFIGLDLNPAQIEENRQKYPNPKFNFLSGNAVNVLPVSGKPYTVFLTNGGVLELFSERDVKALFRTVSDQLSPSLFILIEPLAPDFNLQTETESRPFGEEVTFSHNYPYLLELAHFEIAYKQEVVHDQVRWLMILATAGIQSPAHLRQSASANAIPDNQSA